MKSGSYFVILLMAVACVVLTGALIVIATNNQQLQAKWQTQQQILNQGILGQQAQQISANVVQDMANAATGDPEMRQLLDKYNVRVQPNQQLGPVSRSTEDKGSDAAKPEVVKP